MIYSNWSGTCQKVWKFTAGAGEYHFLDLGACRDVVSMVSDFVAWLTVMEPSASLSILHSKAMNV